MGSHYGHKHYQHWPFIPWSALLWGPIPYLRGHKCPLKAMPLDHNLQCFILPFMPWPLIDARVQLTLPPTLIITDIMIKHSHSDSEKLQFFLAKASWHWSPPSSGRLYCLIAADSLKSMILSMLLEFVVEFLWLDTSDARYVWTMLAHTACGYSNNNPFKVIFAVRPVLIVNRLPQAGVEKLTGNDCGISKIGHRPLWNCSWVHTTDKFTIPSCTPRTGSPSVQCHIRTSKAYYLEPNVIPECHQQSWPTNVSKRGG